MKRKFNFLILILTAVGAALGVCISEIFIMELDINPIIQMGLYFGIPMLLALCGAIVSETVKPTLVHLKRESIYKTCIAIALTVTSIGGFGLPMVGQLLYQLDFAADKKNVVFVMDYSYSMCGDRILNATDGAEKAIMRLRGGDTVSIVVFATQAKCVVNNQAVNEESKKNIVRQIKGDKAINSEAEATDYLNDFEEKHGLGDGTNPENAFATAFDIIPADRLEGTRLFLINDGSGDISDETASKYINAGVSVSVLNISSSTPQRIKELALSTGGRVVEECTPENIESEMLRTMDMIADDLLINRPDDVQDSKYPLYHIALSSVLMLLLGLVMFVAYTVLINRKDVPLIYNLIVSASAAVATALISWFGFFIYEIAAVMVFLFCVAVVVYDAGRIENSEDDNIGFIR